MTAFVVVLVLFVCAALVYQGATQVFGDAQFVGTSSGSGGASRRVRVITANLTLTAADSGMVLICNAADLVITLPSTALGLEFTIVCAALSTGTGLSFSPAAADNINEGVANKDLINTGATDVLGDAVTLIGTGVAASAWFTSGKVGIWAAEG